MTLLAILTSTVRRGGGLTAIVATLVLAACAGEGGQRSATAADLVHIHGLAESEDGLYVATHTGLFEVVGDQIRPVGDATHDLMGFTVAGPGDLVASGHPDLRVRALQVDGKPPLLGLVHSSDGQNWESMSLLGEADFHNLEAAHGRIYGFDGTSGRFMVTEDRKNWDTRAGNLQIIDFAVSPDDADTIVATTPSGLSRSDDGGRTWKPVGSDPIALVDWADDGLYGVTAQQQFALSADGGETWEPRAAVGQVEALHASDGEVYAAVAEQGIMRSTDGGKTFETLVDTSG